MKLDFTPDLDVFNAEAKLFQAGVRRQLVPFRHEELLERRVYQRPNEAGTLEVAHSGEKSG